MKQKDVLAILILLFVFVLAWIGESIYHNSVSSTISDTINQDIAPIEPKFDTSTINKLKERQRVNPSFEVDNVTPTPIQLPSQILSPQVSSQGGKLLL